METMVLGCTELEKCKNQMQSVLSIVLALGNYLNADTKFGKAYGFRIDAINKLESLKASKNAHGSMMNILANLVADNVPDIFASKFVLVHIQSPVIDDNPQFYNTHPQSHNRGLEFQLQRIFPYSKHLAMSINWNSR